MSCIKTKYGFHSFCFLFKKKNYEQNPKKDREHGTNIPNCNLKMDFHKITNYFLAKKIKTKN